MTDPKNTDHKNINLKNMIVMAVIALLSISVGGYLSYSRNVENVTVKVQRAPDLDVSRIWSAGRKRDPNENAEYHFKKHGHEFGFETEEEYVVAAVKFVRSPPVGTLQKVQKDGDISYYNPKTNEFAVKSKKGKIRTYFMMNPKFHGYKSNMEYFNAQAAGK